MATDIEKAFRALSLEEMGSALETLRGIHQEAVDAKRADLMAQLEALGGIPSSSKASSDGRAKPAPKYRSKKDRTLTWSGRGQMAAWLVQEMQETGKPKEFFLA